ncbi:hypothetical protein C8E95_5393 [Pseudonocardia autotrophica]|nr:hypothetical protein C8E95_5393 [Pseudonocardia autotrophica]
MPSWDRGSGRSLWRRHVPSDHGDRNPGRSLRARPAGVVELGARRPGTDAFHARNRWMVDRSDFVIGFPRGDDPQSGTRYTLGHAARLGLPHLVLPV